jgi:hypothetical protein
MLVRFIRMKAINIDIGIVAVRRTSEPAGSVPGGGP